MQHEPGEVPLVGGWVSEGVVRLGATVRRPLKPSSPFVHRLLAHLERIGFAEAPRFLGIDDQQREVLSFIDGFVPFDCRALVWRDEQLVSAASLLRRFHDSTAGSELADGREIVCHNDFGPWNLVWVDDQPVAIIDFDNAAPGRRIDDLAYAAWKHLNLGLLPLDAGEQSRRVQIFCAAYGVPPDDALLEAISRSQEGMLKVIEAAPPGPGKDEALVQLAGERAWLAAHPSLIVST